MDRWRCRSSGRAALLVVLACAAASAGAQQPPAPADSPLQQAATAEVKVVEPLTSDDWKRIWALIILCAFNIIFWGTYEQQGNTLALWVDANTNRDILGWTMPATWYQAFNPLMIVFFTPVIIKFWAWQNKRGQEPSSIAKMAIGCLLLGASFLILLPSSRTVAGGGMASLIPLTLTTAVFTIGELYLSPVGLSLVTKVAPPRMVSMLMGAWFLSSFFGNYMCGFIGTFWEKMSHESFFLLLFALACGAGLGMFAVLKPLKKAMSHGREGAVDL